MFSYLQFFKHLDFTLNQRRSFSVETEFINKLLNVASELLLGFIFSLLVFELFSFCSDEILVITPKLKKII